MAGAAEALRRTTGIAWQELVIAPEADAPNLFGPIDVAHRAMVCSDQAQHNMLIVVARDILGFRRLAPAATAYQLGAPWDYKQPCAV